MKQYRRCAQIAALIILLGIWLFPRPQVPAMGSPEDPLWKALNATGATAQELTVNGWSKLPLHDLSDAEMEGLVSRAMERLGFPSGQYTLTHNRSVNHRQVKAEVQGYQTYAVALVQVLYPSWSQSGHEVYMVINIDRLKPEGSSNIKANITKLLQDNGGSARVNTCLVGWLDGKLEEGQQAAKLSQAFQSIQAEIVNTFGLPNMSSYTGYSPLFGDWIRVGQDRVNINMAIRYSQFDNRTYVMIGSPVITREY